MRDNITLHLEAGATLLGSQNPADYPVTSNRWEGVEQLTYAPLIAGNGLKNIAITGRGTIDGQGESWWQAFNEKTLAYPRPRLIGFADCHNVLIEGITLINSPAWTINPVRCENVNIRGLTIINPPDSPNTDGINPDSCRLVRISDCYVSVGDDCITIKAGTQHEHPDRRAALPRHHHHQLHPRARSRRCGHRQRDERRRAERGHLELRLHRHRPRHPLQIAARARRRGRGCPRQQPDHGRRAVPLHHEPVLPLRRRAG